MYTLIIVNGDGEQVAFPLMCELGAELRIGRSDECEISLPDERHLSRVHCFLAYTEYGFVLTDNNSSNGVYEDDERTQQIFMQADKEYRIGACRIRLSGSPEPLVAEPQEFPVPPPPLAVEEAPPIEEDEPEFEEEATPLPSPEQSVPVPPVDDGWDFPADVAEQNEAAEPPASAPVPAVVPSPERKRRVRFQPPPPRKAIVKRPPPRAFYTAAGSLNTEAVVRKPKQLKHRAAAQGPKVERAPSVPAEEYGLPCEFALETLLMNNAAVLLEGDLLRFSIQAEEDCRVYVIQYDTDNNAAMLVPGVGGASNKLFAGQRAQFPPPGKNSGYELYVEPPYGEDTILVIACTVSCKFDKIWAECYRRSDEWRQIGEVERKAIQFCREMKGGDNALWASAVLKIRTGDESVVESLPAL